MLSPHPPVPTPMLFTNRFAFNLISLKIGKILLLIRKSRVLKTDLICFSTTKERCRNLLGYKQVCYGISYWSLHLLGYIQVLRVILLGFPKSVLNLTFCMTLSSMFWRLVAHWASEKPSIPTAIDSLRSGR